ncbi:hypothetical protein ACFLTR_04910 [Chloroflexota bacterium]
MGLFSDYYSERVKTFWVVSIKASVSQLDNATDNRIRQGKPVLAGKGYPYALVRTSGHKASPHRLIVPASCGLSSQKASEVDRKHKKAEFDIGEVYPLN